MPVQRAAEELGALLRTTIIIPESVSKREVSITIEDEPGEMAIRRLAGSVGLWAVHDGRAVEMTERKGIVEEFTVIRSSFMPVEKVEAAVRTVTGDGAMVAVVDDRVFVAGSRSVVERAAQVQKWFQSGVDGWALQVRVARVSRTFSERYGLQITPGVAARAEMGFDAGRLYTGANALVGARAVAFVEAVAQASANANDSDILMDSPLLVLEGRTARVSSVDSIPVPRRTVSPQGTVSVSGYDTVEAGFSLTVEARRVPSGVMLVLRPEVGQVTGYVEESPIVSKASVEATAVVDSGEWVVLGGLSTLDRRWSSAGLPGTLRSTIGSIQRTEDSDSSIYFLVRAVRVYSSGQARP